MEHKQTEKLKSIIDAAHKIVVLQADNPDADSVGSALALEQILDNLGKEPFLYCAVDIPGYLKYLPGWDRVNSYLPSQFDASIIVDASTMTLFEKLAQTDQKNWLASKPCIVLDHHTTVENEIPFAAVLINQPELSSTGEVIYSLAKELSWPLNVLSQEFMMTAILGDTQGLSNSLASAKTYRALAEMIDSGVNRSKIEEARREYTKMPQNIFKYKAELIKRTEFYAYGRLALVVVPHNEIKEYSPLYNPAPLIQPDMLSTEGVGIAVVLKNYDDGHVTAAIRSNPTFDIANKLGEHFGGGGHPYAAGFKVNDGRSYETIKSEVIKYTSELINTERHA